LVRAQLFLAPSPSQAASSSLFKNVDDPMSSGPELPRELALGGQPGLLPAADHHQRIRSERPFNTLVTVSTQDDLDPNRGVAAALARHGGRAPFREGNCDRRPVNRKSHGDNLRHQEMNSGPGGLRDGVCRLQRSACCLRGCKDDVDIGAQTFRPRRQCSASVQ
jgi:hypothetical protein